MTDSRQTVLILDFGAQYTQLITRRVREHHVFSEIVPHSIKISEVKTIAPKAIILSGGPSSVYSGDTPKFDDRILELDIPVLGICYGLQLMVHHWGGKVESKGYAEYGFAKIHHISSSNLLEGISDETQVWMSHGDAVTSIPDGWRVTARSSSDVIAVVERRDGQMFGTQFHPEVVHTTEGGKILSNFLFNIAHCTPDWTPASFIEKTVSEIRKRVGNEKILCGVSGGVDSAVAAKLIHEAVGDQLKGVFVDHGLLRKNETQYITNTLQPGLGLTVEVYDFSKSFFSKLKGVTNPEEKRTTIGEEFIRSFESIAAREGGIEFLAQGTLYPDVIESGGGKSQGSASVIKLHHNVGGLPEDIAFKLVEPLAELFKDEVREVGKELNIPEGILSRHPFPGPGLAVRIIGEITTERIEILQEADDIYIYLLKKWGLYDEIWQAFCVLIPIKTVGVMGDKRTYENLIALRAVTSLDGMTADWYKMPADALSEISNQIVNKVKGVNRVVYDVSSKPPSTIEWE